MQVGIIGGGAAGMTAAIFAALNGANVTVLEHSDRVGKKILSTGNGKCNFTNLKLSKDDYNGNHPSFAEYPLSVFGMESAVHFFESLGMLAQSKRDGYFYPYTGQAQAVLNVLRFRMESLNVKVMTNIYIKEIVKQKEAGFKVIAKDKTYQFDKVILACGGKAAPNTGSDGTGYHLAKALGHTIYKPLPVLTFLKSTESSLKELAGVRCNAKLTLYVDNQMAGEEEGELQLNKDTVSGIPVFQLSHKAIEAIDAKKNVKILADFMPDRSYDEMFDAMSEVKKMYASFPAGEALCGILHKKICIAVLKKAGVHPGKVFAEISKKEMNKIITVMKQYSFEITSYPGFEAAQATMGGVNTEEVNKTMESKLVSGLYFAGEILDIDGRCGGYNLQWAWSSAYVAACHCVCGEVKCYESINVK